MLSRNVMSRHLRSACCPKTLRAKHFGRQAAQLSNLPTFKPFNASFRPLRPTRSFPALSPIQSRPLTLLELCAFARPWREESALPPHPPRKPFGICTSVARPDLRIPKDLPRPIFSCNSFIFCTYLYPLLSAGNKRLITPVESALTKNSPATPLESALTKTPGGGGPSLECPFASPLFHSRAHGSRKNIRRAGRRMRGWR